jgi:hypothetical protein
MDEHLRDVRALRLVFGLGEKQPAPSRKFRGHPSATSSARQLALTCSAHLTPERHGTFAL